MKKRILGVERVSKSLSFPYSILKHLHCDIGYSWTNKDCEVWVKINGEGRVAVVHNAETSQENINDSKGVPSHVLEDTTLNWFKVYWTNDVYPGSSAANSCSANNCKSTSDGYCVCKTTVSNDVVFTDLSGTKEEILSQLFIGAPSIPTGSTPESKFKCVNTDCLVEYIAHNTVVGTVDVDTVFEVQDFAGRTFLLKNVASSVGLDGWQMLPQIYEAEDATSSINTTVTVRSAASGDNYMRFDRTGTQDWREVVSASPPAFIEWDNVNVPSSGEYEVSFRYAFHGQVSN